PASCGCRSPATHLSPCRRRSETPLGLAGRSESANSRSRRVGRYTHVSSHAFLFADLCGFTDYTRRLGDERAAELAVAFHERVSELALAEGCEVIKAIGDAVMVRSEDARAALRLGSRAIALGEPAGHPRVRA